MSALLLLIALALPFALGLHLGRRGASRRRALLTSALPFPAVLSALCLYWIADALLATEQECGVDACGMAIGFGLMGLAAAAVLGLAGTGLAWAGWRLAGGRPADPAGSAFE